MLKKLLVVLATVLVILPAAGCSEGGNVGRAPENITKGFTCDAVISYNGMSMTAYLMRPAPGSCRIEITDPIPVAGLVMDWSGDGFKLNYMGINVPFDTDVLPDSSFASAIVNVLETTAQTTEFDVTATDTDTVYSAVCDSGKYTISFNTESGSLTGIDIPSINLSAVFSSFALMGQET